MTIWKNIIRLRSELNKLQIDIDSLFERQIGRGDDVTFWFEQWAGNSPFNVCFQRLFRLETQPNTSVRDRVQVNNDEWRFNWEWSRELTGRLHGELDDMIEVIKKSSISGNGESTWKFLGHKSGVFVTKAMAKLIDDKLIPREPNPLNTLKNNLVPLKIGIFIWRVLRRRIAVKEELDRRGIDLDTLLCPLCNDMVESVDHAIFSCKSAQDIWIGISKWWGLSLPSGYTLDDLIKCSNSLGMEPFKRKVWQAVVWTTCYLIWRNRNLKVFTNDAGSSPKVVSDIQVKSFEWINNRSRKSFVTWQQWLVSPASTSIINVNIDPG